jgi:hypothetical protein
MANNAVWEADRVRASWTHDLVCAAIAAVGTAGVGGWILHSARWVSLVPGTPMAFDTGRASDDLLIQFAQRVSGAISDSDTVARLGGDEFTIILEGLSEPRGESRRVADKILTSLRRPFLLSGKEVQVTASLGWCFTRRAASIGRICWRAPMRPCTPPSMRGRTK